ncbi:MAG TPA: hypothetical protein DD435_15720, partial [Cyanobacteria bacterium UBA8530]|nr:hypothetical protein [Cyanobacteria bacterium UBA8530]
MLRRLLIENFILIEELCLNFGEGATAFTGETGAGKSMILDALAAAIGGRVSPEMIRAGAKRASIEAEFFVDPVVESLLAPLLEEASIDREDRRFLTLMREVNERGGKCRIDGQPLSLQAFKQIGALFIDILGQHEHQHLTKPSNHLALLDGFAGLFPLREEFKARYEDFKKLEVRIEEIRVRRSRLERERELDLFQLAELEEAALQPFEEESLKTERSLLAHAEELAKRTLSGHSLLMGGENPGAVDLLARAAKEIDSVLCYDPTLESLALQLSEISENANLIARELRERSEGNEPDPVRLDGIEARLDLLHTLKRKYGGEISFLLSKRDELKARLEEGVQSDQRLSHLEKERQEKFGLLQELAEKLSIQRKSFSFALQERIEGELGELGMRGTQFVVQLSPKSIGPLGGDEIEFLIAP